MILSAIGQFAKATSSACQPKGSLFGLPTWYKYLEGYKPEDEPTQCVIRLRAISDVWLILSAVIEVLLRLAALGAIAMIVYAGISFITSEGQPDKVKKAINMAISASIGLAISIGAAATVSFIAGRFN